MPLAPPETVPLLLRVKEDPPELSPILMAIELALFSVLIVPALVMVKAVFELVVESIA